MQIKSTLLGTAAKDLILIADHNSYEGWLNKYI